jgi:hypothetical protein
MTSRYIRLNRETLRSIIAALDAFEEGMATHMATQGRGGVEAVQGESRNAKPTK